MLTRVTSRSIEHGTDDFLQVREKQSSQSFRVDHGTEAIADERLVSG